MVGAGIVIMPYLVSQTGVALGFLIFFVSAVLASFSIYVIQTVAVQLNSESFAEIAGHLMGSRNAKYFVNTLLVLALFGPTVSYFIILGDLAIASMPGYNETLVKSSAILLAACLLVYFCLQKSLAQISSTSVVVVGGLVVFVAVLAYNFSSQEQHPTTTDHSADYIEMFATIPSAFMALNCHNNFFQVRSSMRLEDQSISQITKVFSTAICFCAVAYFLVAYMGLTLYGS